MTQLLEFLAGLSLTAIFALVSVQPASAVDATAPAAAPQTGVQPATAAPAPAPAVVPQTGPINTGLRVFTCAHSFHEFIPKALVDLAQTAGIQGHTIAGVSLLGGSPAYRHWNVPDDKNEAKKNLTAGNVDVLTISCMSDPDDGIAKFAKLGLEHNPNIRVTVQKLWIPQDRWPFVPRINQSNLDFNKSTIDDLRKAYDPYSKEMDDYVVALNKSLGKQVVYVVPEGAATIALREKILAGTAPGLKQQSDIFADWWGHPRGPLMLLSSYCHFAVIYRRSPVGLPPPPSRVKLDQGLVLLLQQLAWDAVIHDPMTGVTGN